MKQIEMKAAKIAEVTKELERLTGCAVSLRMDYHTLLNDSLTNRYGLELIEQTILSLPDFNGRDNAKIVGGDRPFRNFYRDLPSSMFSVSIPDDATIILEGAEYDFQNMGSSRYNIDGLRLIAETYGKAWKADEVEVDVEKTTGYCDIYKYVIRFWWD